MDIDLNADLGEGFGPWRIGDDDALLGIVSSANIACGFHAGDPVIMDRTVRSAGARGVDIGAHVSFPDLQGFGRRAMQIEPDEIASMVVYQLGALAGIARRAGQAMRHMSFHGALGNLAAGDAALAETLLRAVAGFDPGLTVISSTSPAIEGAAARVGLRVATTFLADRAYDDAGMLVPRRLPGAVIHDRAALLDRVRRFLDSGSVVTHGGGLLKMPACSILIHGDTAGALELAAAIRGEIEQGGGRIVPVSQQGQT